MIFFASVFVQLAQHTLLQMSRGCRQISGFPQMLLGQKVHIRVDV